MRCRRYMECSAVTGEGLTDLFQEDAKAAGEIKAEERRANANKESKCCLLS